MTKYIVCLIAGFAVSLILFKQCTPTPTVKTNNPQQAIDSVYKAQKDKYSRLNDSLSKEVLTLKEALTTQQKKVQKSKTRILQVTEHLPDSIKEPITTYIQETDSALTLCNEVIQLQSIQLTVKDTLIRNCELAYSKTQELNTDLVKQLNKLNKKNRNKKRVIKILASALILSGTYIYITR